MKACAVICEYNPFHFGHLHQLQALRETFGTVVCLLGGSLTQRGEVAVADPYTRASAAVACGADLVLALPVPWCCASAQDFAFGGVALAKAIGADALAFSAESGEIALREAAKARTDAERIIRERIREKGALSYPAAAEEVLGTSLQNRPNDILAIEYLRAAGAVGLPCHILRREPTFASSTSLRKAGVPSGSLPERAETVLRKDASFPRETETLGKFLLASLRNDPPRGCYGVPEELYVRMVALALETDDYGEFVRRCVNKVFTASRIRRAALSMAFAFPAELPKKEAPYTVLLAANEAGRAFLRRTAKTRTVPVVSRPASLRGDEVYALNARVQDVLRLYYGGAAAHEGKPVT